MSKEVLIRSDRHNLVVADKFSLKSLLKHAVVLSFLVIATMTLFHLNLNNIKEVQVNLEQTIEIFSRIFIVYFLMYFQLRYTLKMINYSNNTIYFSVGASILSIAYAVYLYITLNKEMVELITLIWYFLPVQILVFVWKVCQIFFERRPNPILSRTLIISAINTAAFVGLLLYGYYMYEWYVDKHLFYDNKVITIVNLIAVSVIFITYISTMIYTIAYTFKHHAQSALRNSLLYSGALMLLLPFTIWFIYFSIDLKTNWESILYLCSYIVLGLSAIYVGIFWRKSLGSPLIISVMYTMILALAWTISMLTTAIDQYSESVGYLFSKACPLAVSVIVFGMIYIKNPRVQFVELMAWIFILGSMAYWLIEVTDLQVQLALAAGTPFEEQIWSMMQLIDGVMMIFPVFILAVNIWKWYQVQRSIKSKTSKAKHILDRGKKAMMKKISRDQSPEVAIKEAPDA